MNTSQTNINIDHHTNRVVADIAGHGRFTCTKTSFDGALNNLTRDERLAIVARIYTGTNVDLATLRTYGNVELAAIVAEATDAELAAEAEAARS